MTEKITPTIPFDFDELYNGVKTKFDAAGYDTAEGSNTSQLITAMAYLTSMLNVNTAVNVNETILPLATRRDNALYDARALGYEVQHKQSYTYILTLSFTAGNHTIPKYAKFQDEFHTYYYIGNQIELIDVANGYQIELPVKEGNVYTFTENADSLVTVTRTVTDSTGVEVPQYYIDIPYVDVEENGIEVYLTYYDDFGILVTREEWKKSRNVMIDEDAKLNKEFIRMDNIEFQTPRVYFKLGGVGEDIRVGTIVEINVLTTAGASGALVDINNPALLLHTIPNCTITGISVYSEGTDEESLESIKLNAPKFYNSANRAVTKSDYEAICNRQSPVNNSLVWGGDDELPKCPGHIWFSFVPSKNPRFFDTDEFKSEFILRDWGDIAWDYTLVGPAPTTLPENYTVGEQNYVDQFNLNEEFYSSRFLENNEIRSSEYTEDGQLIQPGVWDVLDGYKIPTLEFHNRHPFFLDFEYDITILKYNISVSKSDIHQNVFNSVNNFFTGVNDTVKMEQFETEYFHSSIKKRIDTTLSDETGFNNLVTTKLLLTKKNVSQENSLDEYRDIFIPMAVPYESYFDNSGYLLYNVLPSIDTLNFIEYAGETGQDLYTDWSGIQADITATITQQLDPMIVAPIRIKQSESIVATAAQTVFTFTNIKVVPDDPTELDATTPAYAFDKTVIALNGVPLTYNTQWFFDDTDLTTITLSGVTVNAGDTLSYNGDVYVGSYNVVNSFRKYIYVQLFIDANGWIDGTAAQTDYNTPKSYLTTSEGFYDFTIDNFYLTTEGYSITAENQQSDITGNIVKNISPALYTSTPIKMDLFRKNRYLNINYNSANFSLLKNVLPRLKRVTFAQGV